MEADDAFLLRTQLLYRQHPSRSFLLRGRPNADISIDKELYFVTESIVKSKQATVRFQPLDTVNFDDYNRFFAKSVYGILGLFEYANGKF